MADSDIKTHPLALSLCFPLPFSLYHTDSSACSCLLMCGSRAGWKTYCSINHVPFFSATHSTRALSETEATFSQPLCKNAKMTNIPPDSELRLRQTVPIPITWSLTDDVPPPCQSLGWHCVDSILIYRGRGVCCVQTKPPSPLCYANKSNIKIEREEEEGRCRFSSMSGWCIQEFLSFKSLFQRTRIPKHREHCH